MGSKPNGRYYAHSPRAHIDIVIAGARGGASSIGLPRASVQVWLKKSSSSSRQALDSRHLGPPSTIVLGLEKMFKRSEKKIKAVFKMQFQATRVPQLKSKSLMISLVPVDVGKPTVRLAKAPIVEGTCTWENPVYETVKLVKEIKTGRIREKFYYVIVSTGREKAVLQDSVASTVKEKRGSEDLSLEKNGQSVGNCNASSLSSEVASLKERNKSMEEELREMHERYSEISLRFAEVEGERQQLVMALRNLKSGKKN
ncbi:hypothetical protein Sango_2623200 [Sesamum angolense]|uniref:C2 NT-type domain-containing protein n=1 Tax=Sesamum angolense TaxID=2727404 RepID=A0AAE1TCS5_9LAMI|nr:hypothetical protein Sango_2623200 [Sesamum angolense]